MGPVSVSGTVASVTDGKMPLRAKVATSVSRTAAALSRAAGRGDGSVIGGWLGLKIDPTRVDKSPDAAILRWPIVYTYIQGPEGTFQPRR